MHIKAIHAQTRGGYGWPRTWKELLARGIRVGKERVQKLMQLHGIRAKGKRRFKVTTDSNHDLPIAPNLLDRQFTVAAPDRVWAGDITYLHTDEGWLFLAVVIDLFSRQVVGWSLREEMTRLRRRPDVDGGDAGPTAAPEAHIVQITGESYRFEDKRRAGSAPKKAAAA